MAECPSCGLDEKQCDCTAEIMRPKFQLAEQERDAARAEIKRLAALLRRTTEYEIHEDGCACCQQDAVPGRTVCDCLLGEIREAVEEAEQHSADSADKNRGA